MKPPKASLSQISKFLDTKRIAIAGVSRNPQKFGHQAYQHLQERGYELFPVNPNAGVTDDLPYYISISDLPEEVKHLYIVTNKKETEKAVMEAIAHGIDHIWIQRTSETAEAIVIAREAGVNLITGECIFMWTEPVTGVHRFHRSLRKFFGLLPR